MKKTAIPNTDAIGEHEIIQIIRENLTPMPNMPVPFGDDVSALTLPSGGIAVLKTDMLVAATDVPNGMSLYDAARKAIVMNISDFASKGVAPTAALVALGIPKELANHVGLPQRAEDFALRFGEKISLGKTPYLAMSCINIINYTLDRQLKQDS